MRRRHRPGCSHERAALQGFFGSLMALAGMLGLCNSASAETIQLGGATGIEYFHEGLLVRPTSFDVNDFFSQCSGHRHGVDTAHRLG